jgi:hypothetical protein
MCCWIANEKNVSVQNVLQSQLPKQSSLAKSIKGQ